MHQKNIINAGEDLHPGSRVLILLHGRGSSAEEILSLTPLLDVKDFTILAPQATYHAWYPHSFLAPPSQNEPWLSSALTLLSDMLDDLYGRGVPSNHIYFAGFSQGACLALEFIARNANRYGGAAAFTGGLIGDRIYSENYKGQFDGMPVFIGTSDPDPHVPVERVHATSGILKEMGAVVNEKVYTNLGHTISQDEVDHANRIVFNPRS